MTLPRFRENLDWAGPAGLLEGRLEHSGESPSLLVVFGHPHPQHGGSMLTNGVVHGARALVSEGAAVLRFNFRGVGRSEGSYDEGVGENEDYRSAVDLLRERFGRELPLIAAGFSFGAIRALECAAKGVGDAWLGLAPPITLEKYGTLPGIDMPAAMVLAGSDELVPAPDDALRERLFRRGCVVETVEDAGHLFTHRWHDLRAAVVTAVRALRAMMQEAGSGGDGRR